MLLLVYVGDKDTLYYFASDITFKNYDNILMMFELMKFLLVEIDYKFMMQFKNLYGEKIENEKLFQISPDLCEPLYLLIHENIDMSQLKCISSYALKIMSNNESAIIWMKIATKKYVLIIETSN